MISIAKAWILAPVAAVSLSLSAIGIARADEFADLCAAGGAGLEAQDCACMDARVTDPAERADLLAMFRVNAEAERTGNQPDESSPVFEQGLQVLNKYLNECAK